METYTFLRQLADSWVLLLLFLFFLGAIVWAFRPGSRQTHLETSQIPFRNDRLDCSGTCETCRCDADTKSGPEA